MTSLPGRRRQGDRPALRGGAGEVRVAESVTCPVDTRALAVPDAQDPLVGRVGLFGRELAPHHGGCAEFFVDGRLEYDVDIGRYPQCLFELHVEAAEGEPG